MRILMLAPHPFFVERGTPIAVELLARTFSARGDEVDLVTYHLGNDISHPGVTIHRASGPQGFRSIRPGFSLRKIICDAYLFRTAWRLAGEGDYDVVHAGEEAVFIAMALKARFGIPYVYDMDSSIAQQLVEKIGWLRPLARVFDSLEGWAVRGSIATAPVCNALADVARERGAGFVETLHDVSQLTASDFNPTAGIRARWSTPEPFLLYVGNLEAYQGVDLLLESCARAMDERAFHLVVAGGSGEAIEEYRAKAAMAGIAERTHFIGRWPVDRLGELLGEADILVSPRIQGVNTPMKIFPYLHSGRPLLATDITSHNQILTGSIALLAAPSPAAFANAIVQLLDDEGLRERLGRSGRRFIEQRHTPAAFRERVDRLYGHVQRELDATGNGMVPKEARL